MVVARGQVGCVDRKGRLLLTELAAAAGARLREIGGVEHVSAEDYRRATDSPAAMLLRVTPAHYAISGDVQQATLDEIVEAGRRAGLPVVDFLPAALLVEMPGAAWSAPLIGQSLVAGADIVVANAERYLGGPSCGIIAGRREFVDRVANHPVSSVLAADRLMLAALEATLMLARSPSAAEQGIPLWQLLGASPDALRIVHSGWPRNWPSVREWRGPKFWTGSPISGQGNYQGTEYSNQASASSIHNNSWASLPP